VDEIHRVAGTVYQREGSELHTAAPCTDLVATLVLHGESGDTAEVFRPPGKSGEEDDRPLPVDNLRALLDEIVAALPDLYHYGVIMTLVSR